MTTLYSYQHYKKVFHTQEIRNKHQTAVKCLVTLITASKPIVEVSKCICHFCKTEYISRNEFFRHLNDSYITNTPPTAPIITNVAAAISLSKAASLPVLEKPKSSETASVPMGGFIWLKFAIQASPDTQETIICRNSGTGHDLVDQEWLKQFEYTIEQQYDDNVSSFNGCIIKLHEYINLDVLYPRCH